MKINLQKAPLNILTNITLFKLHTIKREVPVVVFFKVKSKIAKKSGNIFVPKRFNVTRHLTLEQEYTCVRP